MRSVTISVVSREDSKGFMRRAGREALFSSQYPSPQKVVHIGRIILTLVLVWKVEGMEKGKKGWQIGRWKDGKGSGEEWCGAWYSLKGLSLGQDQVVAKLLLPRLRKDLAPAL